MTRDDFEEMMNDAEPPVTIMGFEFQAGTALRQLDPAAFTELYWAFYHSMPEEEQACTE